MGWYIFHVTIDGKYHFYTDDRAMVEWAIEHAKSTALVYRWNDSTSEYEIIDNGQFTMPSAFPAFPYWFK